jgi:glycosyltransferase involved in cell wall biosynthesis
VHRTGYSRRVSHIARRAKASAATRRGEAGLSRFEVVGAPAVRPATRAPASSVKTMKPRILLWYWGRRGYGAQFTLGLAAELAERNDVTVELALSAQGHLNEQLIDLGLPTHTIDTYDDMASFAAALPRIPRAGAGLLAQARQCDVVVSTMTHLWTPFAAPRLARAGIPFVPVVHDAEPHPGDLAFGWSWRLRRELGPARAAVVLSDFVAEALQLRAPSLPLIRATLPALLIGNVPVSRSIGTGRFLFFGRLRAYKGLDLLRDAFALLHARHPHATLRVVGEGDAEACAPGLSALPGVRVEPRWVPDAEIPALLAAADAVVLPYREASQSAIIPQAFALGVPIVATAVGGLTEQLGDGQGSVIAEDLSPAAFAAAMERMLEPEQAARLQEQAAEAGRAATDWNGTAEAIVAGLRRTTL